MVPTVPEGERTLGQGFGACWVPFQVGLRRGMLVQDIHVVIVVKYQLYEVDLQPMSTYPPSSLSNVTCYPGKCRP